MQNDQAPRAPSSNVQSGGIEEVEVSVRDGEDVSGKPRIKKQRVRIGRDGKPLPPRKPRNAPTEDDLARDALVERLLSENRFDKTYMDATEPSKPQQSGLQPGQNEDADSRMAEDFRREFLANAAENRAKRQAGPPTAKGAEVMKGPKMGGSRNQRAVAANQEKAKAAK